MSEREKPIAKAGGDKSAPTPGDPTNPQQVAVARPADPVAAPARPKAKTKGFPTPDEVFGPDDTGDLVTAENSVDADLDADKDAQVERIPLRAGQTGVARLGQQEVGRSWQSDIPHTPTNIGGFGHWKPDVTSDDLPVNKG